MESSPEIEAQSSKESILELFDQATKAALRAEPIGPTVLRVLIEDPAFESTARQDAETLQKVIEALMQAGTDECLIKAGVLLPYLADQNVEAAGDMWSRLDSASNYAAGEAASDIEARLTDPRNGLGAEARRYFEEMMSRSL